MERFIFDLDNTLLTGDFKEENNLFRNRLSAKDAESFIEKKFDLLMEYEATKERYDINILSQFLSDKSGINISSNIIEEWIDYNSNMKDIINPDAFEVLTYLRDKNKSLAILTNWFEKTQIARLKKAGLLDFFDDVYAGDSYIKPNKQAYINACGNFDVTECIIIGDNLGKDVMAPRELGINSIYYNENNLESVVKPSIKNLKKIKEMY